MPIFKNVLTQCVQSTIKPEQGTGSVIAPIFQTSTFAQEAPGVCKGYEYSRAKNPTRDHLESSLAQIENARFGLSFASGLAAEQAIIQLCPPNKTVLVCDDVYGGTGRLFRKIYAKYGITFKFIDMTDSNEVEKNIDDNVFMIWIESPTNPTLKIIDIEKISSFTKKFNIITVVDNTFCSPIFQKPLELGADIVVHSTTKYIGGHSDIIGGAVMTSSIDLHEQLSFHQMAIGAIPSPFECFLTSRSIKTLALRMKQHEINALEVAKFLKTHPKCYNVLYPGLECHPQYDLAKKQMMGFSGMISFNLKGDYDTILHFFKNLKIFILAESLGGVESLINHPEKMTHASVPKELREKLGITSNLLRLSAGIEDTQDLIDDLKQALEKA